MSPLADRAEELTDLVVHGATRQASALVLSELERGHPASRLVNELLVPVQLEVGARWQRNQMSVAEEHAATATVDAAFAALVAAVPAQRQGHRGTLVVACAEGEWHTLPARMAAELWRWDGWDVTFLGGSVPSADLGPWLKATRPDALAVSASVSMFVGGVLRVLDEAALAGVPAVTGGRGLGQDGRRARRLGARWAGSTGALVAALAGPPPTVDAADLAGRRHEAADLELRAGEVVDRAMDLLYERVPEAQAFSPGQLLATERDYGYTLQFLSAAVLCDDPQLFGDYLGWLQTVLTSRGVPPFVVRPGVEAFVAALPAGATRAQTICEATASAIG